MPIWNPWHGCHKLSAGCMHCYMYRTDAKHNRDSSEVTRTRSFDLPLKRTRTHDYKIASGATVYTCFSSDFFVEEADAWRPEAWEMIRERNDLHFLIITKRIDRLHVGLPADWGCGYEHVTICCTIENQDRADYRLPIYREAPIRHKLLICEPLLGPIDLSAWPGAWFEQIIAGGESGLEARVCHFDWILDLRRQCMERGVSFRFKQTGARLLKNGILYRIRRQYQHTQARKAGINYK